MLTDSAIRTISAATEARAYRLAPVQASPYARRERREAKLGALGGFPIVDIGPILDPEQSDFLKWALTEPRVHDTDLAGGVMGPSLAFTFVTKADTLCLLIEPQPYQWWIAHVGSDTATIGHVTSFAVLKPEMITFLLELFPEDDRLLKLKQKGLPWRGNWPVQLPDVKPSEK